MGRPGYVPDRGDFILADHVRCVDWRQREVRLMRKAPPSVLEEVVAKLEALIINPDD